MINFYKKNKIKKGFTLVETLVALFIFSVSVIAVMSALSQGITGTNYAKNKMVAEFLSQEGIEYFRNIRDTYMLYSDDKDQAWTGMMSKFKTGGCINGGCYFDNNEYNIPINEQLPITKIEINPCGNGKCPFLSYNESSGKYSYSNINESIFSRKIYVTEIDDNNIKIVSEVIFYNNSKLGRISFSENLSKWVE